MDSSTSLIRAIAYSWDDPLPVLVFADWAEEHGQANPRLLRWYAREVMPAVASVSPNSPPSPTAGRDRARKALRSHPDSRVLFQLAAVAFCRRPCVWDRLPPTPGQYAVVVARLSALGLATVAERKSLWRTAVTAQKKAQSRLDELQRPEVQSAFPSPALAEEATRSASHEWIAHSLAKLLMEDAGPAVARCAYQFARSYEMVLAEIGYQKAMYEALARVAPQSHDRQDTERVPT